jgi:hypothetical protein
MVVQYWHLWSHPAGQLALKAPIGKVFSRCMDSIPQFDCNSMLAWVHHAGMLPVCLCPNTKSADAWLLSC